MKHGWSDAQSGNGETCAAARHVSVPEMGRWRGSGDGGVGRVENCLETAKRLGPGSERLDYLLGGTEARWWY
jgi:hypothetical protein